MSAIRSASSIAVTSIPDRSQVRCLVWSVSRPGVATSRSIPRCSSAAWRLKDIPPTTEVTVRPSALAYGSTASTTCWASSRVGTSTSPRGRRGCARSPSSRVSSARPKARVLPEPVWPRPSRSRPASVSGSVAAWMGNGAVKPPAASARSTGAGRPSSANDGIPVSGTVHSTSGGIAVARAGAGPPVPREPRDERGRPPPEGRRDDEAFAVRGARRAKGEDKRTSGTWHVAAGGGSAEMAAAGDHSGRARARGDALMSGAGCARYDGLSQAGTAGRS